jgi:hypothetical protein
VKLYVCWGTHGEAFHEHARRTAHNALLRRSMAWIPPRLGVRAWLIHLFFVDDPHRPTTVAAWEDALGLADKGLDLRSPSTPPHTCYYLPERGWSLKRTSHLSLGRGCWALE